MISKAQILIIDDEEKLRQLFSRIIELEGYTVQQAANLKQGLKLLEQDKSIDIVLSDVKLPDGNGIDQIEKIKSIHPTCEVIVMTAFSSVQDGVKAMKRGAFDYFTKGDDNDQILPAIQRASAQVALKKRVYDLENKLELKYGFGNILGESPSIKSTIRLAEKVAPTDSTVLLEGETGVGKELFAQALHYGSPRNNNPFVALNCSAFPKDLLESELFGYRKGAFTGALHDKKGLFEEAHEGTLFLDEIGEMSLDLQAKLLRVLETQSFLKIGDSKPTQVHVRIVAATNRDLKAESEKEHFRPDLYYRLSSFRIAIPPLRDRKEDIELLANYFLQNYSSKLKKHLQGMEKDFIRLLKHYSWKGNIRELKNVIERASILSDTDTLTVDLLPPEITDASGDFIPSSLSLAAVEKAHIQKVLVQTKSNKTKTAELLGIGLTTLYRKLEEYQIEK